MVAHKSTGPVPAKPVPRGICDVQDVGCDGGWTKERTETRSVDDVRGAVKQLSGRGRNSNYAEIAHGFVRINTD